MEHRAKQLQVKLDRLDEAFVFERAIARDTYDRQRARLLDDIADARVEQQTSELEELDAQGILEFAQQVLPRASELWVHATLDQRQRLQQLFFPDGIVVNGHGFDRTAVNTPAFNWLGISEDSKTSLVDQAGIEPATS